MKLDFLLCGSPTDAFFSQMAFFRLSLDALGGDYRAARVVAVFGDHAEARVPAGWRPHLDRIAVEWAHAPGAPNPMHRAQHDRRFTLIRPEADLAFLCDADVIPLRPLDTLIEELLETPALAGVIAHFHFSCDGVRGDPDVDWPEIAEMVIGKAIDRPHRYTLLPADAPAQAPFYINYGVLAGPPALLAEVHRRDVALRDRVAAILDDWWAPQVSLALACADLALPTRALPMRYNFPNDPRADRLYPEELGRIVFLHYLRLCDFRRDAIFADPSAFRDFLARDLKGSSAVFRERVSAITGGAFPFPRP